MKTSIAVSLLALIAPICAVPVEPLGTRHFTFSEPAFSTISLQVVPPISFPTGTGFPAGTGLPPFPILSTHPHKPHKTGGLHAYGSAGGLHAYGSTGGPIPTHLRPTGARSHPHPTGGYQGGYQGGHHGTGRQGGYGPRA